MTFIIPQIPPDVKGYRCSSGGNWGNFYLLFILRRYIALCVLRAAATISGYGVSVIVTKPML
jgi:hypothetical protein